MQETLSDTKQSALQTETGQDLFEHQAQIAMQSSERMQRYSNSAGLPSTQNHQNADLASV